MRETVRIWLNIDENVSHLPTSLYWLEYSKKLGNFKHCTDQIITKIKKYKDTIQAFFALLLYVIQIQFPEEFHIEKNVPC